MSKWIPGQLVEVEAFVSFYAPTQAFSVHGWDVSGPEFKLVEKFTLTVKVPEWVNGPPMVAMLLKSRADLMTKVADLDRLIAVQSEPMPATDPPEGGTDGNG